MIEKEVGIFTLDGMAADNGHNAMVPTFCSPSNPLFEEKLENHFVWVFPPLELIGITLKFLIAMKREGITFSCCCLVPERANAPWYRYLKHFQPVKRFNPGSDFFGVSMALLLIGTPRSKNTGGSCVSDGGKQKRQTMSTNPCSQTLRTTFIFLS